MSVGWLFTMVRKTVAGVYVYIRVQKACSASVRSLGSFLARQTSSKVACSTNRAAVSSRSRSRCSRSRSRSRRCSASSSIARIFSLCSFSILKRSSCKRSNSNALSLTCSRGPCCASLAVAIEGKKRTKTKERINEQWNKIL